MGEVPHLDDVGWTAWLLARDAALRAHLRRPAVVVPVFDAAPSGGFWGAPGATVNVTMPLAGSSLVELDFALTCPSQRDFGCGIWDRVMSVSVCCERAPSAECGVELGRWITSFRRSVGHWVTDVSHLAALLRPGARCTFTAASTPEVWFVSLALRFSLPVPVVATGAAWPRWHGGRRVAAAAAAAPRATVVPLWNGNFVFDKTYNDRPPRNVTAPAATRKAVLSAVVTGHGSDEYGCGEFCATTHEWVVGGRRYVQNFSLPLTDPQLGCANKGYAAGVAAESVNAGDVAMPNEHGTWYFGRNGWCNGQRVAPWVVDVTAGVPTDGRPAVVEYYGYFQGETPDPKHSPGNMLVQSFLTLYQ